MLTSFPHEDRQQNGDSGSGCYHCASEPEEDASHGCWKEYPSYGSPDVERD